MPILKQLVSGSSQTKRRSRMDLTREMISSPLGDFRHTMHVGRSGDAFGDTSFLSSRSGEPPPPPPGTTSSSSSSSSPPPYPHSPRPGFLTRTFRSSKRSQSVNRVDQHRGEALLASPGHCSSPGYVKNAMSLPFLNDEGRVHGAAATKSLTSSPLRQPPGGAANGNADATAETRCLELEERSFGELTELPEAAATSPYRGGGGMKRAESVMSFHIDLGPSMLGDILGVMEKEDDDLGYEEGKGSDGHASPPLSTAGDDSSGAGGAGEELDVEEEELDVEEEEEEEELQHDSMHAGSSVDLGPECGAPDTPQCTPEARPKQQPKHRLQQQHLDSSSLSSSGSVATEPGEKVGGQVLAAAAADTDSATFSAPPEEEEAEEEEEEEQECHFSSFLEDEDDEIRV